MSCHVYYCPSSSLCSGLFCGDSVRPTIIQVMAFGHQWVVVSVSSSENVLWSFINLGMVKVEWFWYVSTGAELWNERRVIRPIHFQYDKSVCVGGDANSFHFVSGVYQELVMVLTSFRVKLMSVSQHKALCHPFLCHHKLISKQGSCSSFHLDAINCVLYWFLELKKANISF